MSVYSECREILPGLILGSISDVEKMVSMGADALVPLAFMDGSVWDTAFRGEIIYCPVRDRGVLPEDVLRELIDKICHRLDEGKMVAIFCAGGHGRTGYIAGCVLGKKGIKDPIGYLRREYSPKAVETGEQAVKVLEYVESLNL